ncbi:protein FLX-like 2 [Pistacia vera]|uniref:protein FLX-like 2 n=1 Tax=Pistacia vera TaxID=55513 RepID=UPI001262D5A8|nr:protein FLX-like 2 [Pistacia vera]XP_031279295.1 protein FLX-like 2 [Pistacia vera]
MGSKGRMPPPHLRRPLPGPGIMHPDPYGPGIRPMPGAFPPFDMLPPPEVMEQKIAAQHVEMQKLVTENQRLAATHGTLRQELAAAQHELQILHAQIGAMKSEREQQMRSLTDKIAKMEADLKAAEPVKLELQQARTDAQNLAVAREELISKVHQLTQDLQRTHADVQQIPALMSELDGLRQEYHHCRATYEYEKKFYNDHLESLQVMEKNYITMAREVEKLRAELTNVSNVDRRAGGPYGSATGNNENDTSGHPAVQNAYEDGYGVPQGHGPLPPASAGASTGANASVGTPVYVGAQSGHPPARAGYDVPRAPGYEPSKGPGYDAQRGPNYDAQRGPNYDAQRGPNYDAQRGPGYDIHRGPGYDTQRGPAYDAQRGPGYDLQRVAGYDPQRVAGYDPQRGHGYDVQKGQAYDMQRGPGYDSSRGTSYDGPARGATAPHGQVPPLSNAPYGSATPPARSGSGYEAPTRGGNAARR